MFPKAQIIFLKPELKLGQRTVCLVTSAFLQLQMTSTIFRKDIGTDYKCCSELLSALTVRKWI